MKRLQKGLVLSMALAFLMTSALAPEVSASTSKHITAAKQEKNASMGKSQNKAQASSKAVKVTTETKKLTKAEYEAQKAALEAQKEAIEEQKDKLEEQKDSLETQYEAAKESGNTELANQLKTQLDQLKKDFDALKQQAALKRAEMKAAIKAQYTSTELAALKTAGDTIKKKNKNVVVLPVENIIVKGTNVKFDAPPVIKSGRTLIPVRALSAAFGAEVKWIAAEKKVVITKGTTEIVLILNSNKMYVNGVETTLDVPATSMSGRTVVPLSFIVKNLGLKVKWNGDSKDIEIEQPGTVTPPTTSGSAIDTTTGGAVDTTSGSSVTTTTGSAIDSTTGTTAEITPTAVTIETLR